MGMNFGEAFLKAQIGAGSPLPEKGTVFIGVNETGRHRRPPSRPHPRL
jgi:hypothetical protein